MQTRRHFVAWGLVVASVPGALRAHGEKHAGAPVRREQKPWGIAGEPSDVARTVEIRMSDAMRFTPDFLRVRQGETLRLAHYNGGKLMHEFVLGTRQELEAHAALMLRFPDMEHDEPYMAHVPPGRRAEIVWHFNRAGDFEFACLIAGHFQAGMVGRIQVEQA